MNIVFINDIHSPPPFVSFSLVLDGMKVDVAKVQNHHAWDHTDGDEIKLLWVALTLSHTHKHTHTQCMLSEDDWIGCKVVICCMEVRGGVSEPPTAVTSAWQRSGAPWSPSPTVHLVSYYLWSCITCRYTSCRRRQISSVICEWISIPRTKSVLKSMSSGRPARANLTDEASPFLLSHVPVREGERDEEASRSN